MLIESAIDIDWFALDAMDNIMHFASGGGKLPAVVKSQESDGDSPCLFFHKLPETFTEVTRARDLSQFISIGASGIESYLRDFKQMAHRGLYSLDKSILNNPLDNRYHVVYGPKNRLRLVDLPPEIQGKLVRLKFDFVVEELSQVDISAFV